MTMIVAKVLKKYLPQLKFHLESFPDNFGQYHSEFSHKTGFIPLPLLNLNENCEQDATKILDFYINEEPINLGNLKKRFANFRSTTFESFHLGMNFLDKIVFEPLWSSQEEELCTLYGEKEQIFC